MLRVLVELPAGSGRSRWLTETVPTSGLFRPAGVSGSASAAISTSDSGGLCIYPHGIERYLVSKLRLEHGLRRDDLNDHILSIRELIPTHVLAGQQAHGVGAFRLNRMVDAYDIPLDADRDVLTALDTVRSRNPCLSLGLVFMRRNSAQDAAVNLPNFDFETFLAANQRIPDNLASRFLRRMALYPFVQRPVNSSVDSRTLLKAVIEREYAKSRLCGFVDVLHPVSDSWQERWMVLTDTHISIFVVTDEKGAEPQRREVAEFLRPRETIYLNTEDMSVSVVGSREWQVYTDDRCFTFRCPGASEMLSWVSTITQKDKVLSENMLLTVSEAVMNADVSAVHAFDAALVRPLRSVRGMLHHSVLRDKLQHFAKENGHENLFLAWINCRAFEITHPLTRLVSPSLSSCEHWAQAAQAPQDGSGTPSQVLHFRHVHDFVEADDIMAVTYHALNIFVRFLSVEGTHTIDGFTDQATVIRGLLSNCLRSQEAAGLSPEYDRAIHAETSEVIFPSPTFFHNVRCGLESCISGLVLDYGSQFAKLVQPRGGDVKGCAGADALNGDVRQGNARLNRSTSGRSFGVEANTGVRATRLSANAVKSSGSYRHPSESDNKIVDPSSNLAPVGSIAYDVALQAGQLSSLEQDTISDRVWSPASWVARNGSFLDAQGPDRGRSKSASSNPGIGSSRGNGTESTNGCRKESAFPTISSRRPSEGSRGRCGSEDRWAIKSFSDLLDASSQIDLSTQSMSSMLQLIGPVQIRSWWRKWNKARGLKSAFSAASAKRSRGATIIRSKKPVLYIPTCKRSRYEVSLRDQATDRVGTHAQQMQQLHCQDSRNAFECNRVDPTCYFGGIDIEHKILVILLHKYKVDLNALSILKEEIHTGPNHSEDAPKKGISLRPGSFTTGILGSASFSNFALRGADGRINEEESVHGESVSDEAAMDASSVHTATSKHEAGSRYLLESPCAPGTPARKRLYMDSTAWCELWAPNEYYTGIIAARLAALPDTVGVHGGPVVKRRTDKAMSPTDASVKAAYVRAQDAASQAALITLELEYLDGMEGNTSRILLGSLDRNSDEGGGFVDDMSNPITQRFDPSAANADLVEPPTPATAQQELTNEDFSAVFGFDKSDLSERDGRSDLYLQSCWDWSTIEHNDCLLRDDGGSAILSCMPVQEFDPATAKDMSSISQDCDVREMRRASSLPPQKLGRRAASIRGLTALMTRRLPVPQAASTRRPLVGLAFVLPEKMRRPNCEQGQVKAEVLTSPRQSAAEACYKPLQSPPGAPSKAAVQEPRPVTRIQSLPLLPLKIVCAGWVKVLWMHPTSQAPTAGNIKTWFEGTNGGQKILTFTDLMDDAAGESSRECALEIDYDECLQHLAVQCALSDGAAKERSGGPSRNRATSADLRRKSLADDAFFGKALDDLGGRPSKRLAFTSLFRSSGTDSKTPDMTPRASFVEKDRSPLAPSTDEAILPSEGRAVTKNWKRAYCVLYADGTLALAGDEVDISEEATYMACSAFFSSLHRTGYKSPFWGALSLAHALDVGYSREIDIPSTCLELVTRRGVLQFLPSASQAASSWLHAMRSVVIAREQEYTSGTPEFAFRGTVIEAGAASVSALGDPLTAVIASFKRPVVSDGSGAQIRTATITEASVLKRGRYGGQWKRRLFRIVVSYIHRRIVTAQPPLLATATGGSSIDLLRRASMLDSYAMTPTPEVINSRRSSIRREATSRDARSDNLDVRQIFLVDAHDAVKAWAGCLADILAPGFVDTWVVPIISGAVPPGTSDSSWVLHALATAGHALYIEPKCAHRVAETLPLFARVLMKGKQLSRGGEYDVTLVGVLEDIAVQHYMSIEVAALYFRDQDSRPTLKGTIPLIHNGQSRTVHLHATAIAAAPLRVLHPSPDTPSSSSTASRFAVGVRKFFGLPAAAADEDRSPPRSPTVSDSVPRCHFQLQTTERAWELGTSDVISLAEWLMLLRLFMPTRTQQLRRKFLASTAKPYNSVVHGEKAPVDDGSCETFTIPYSYFTLSNFAHRPTRTSLARSMTGVSTPTESSWGGTPRSGPTAPTD